MIGLLDHDILGAIFSTIKSTLKVIKALYVSGKIDERLINSSKKFTVLGRLYLTSSGQGTHKGHFRSGRPIPP